VPLYEPEYIDTLAARGDVKALIKALRDGETLDLARTALIKIGEPAVQPLVKALRDGGVSFIASKVLKDIGPPSIEPLVKALEKKRGSGFAAAALEDIGEPAVGALIDALEREGERTRILAVRALGVIGDHGAINPIQVVFLENLTTEANQTLHEVCLEALKVLGVRLRYAEEIDLTLEEFLSELKVLGFSKSSRSKNAYTHSLVPDVRFQILKRIVRLDGRIKDKEGRRGWKRVRSYSIKRELWLAMRVAELMLMGLEQRDEPNS
jgi:HEAT repeat protein